MIARIPPPTRSESARLGPKPIRVVIADDAAIVREILRSVLDDSLEFSVVGVATSGRECVELVRRLKPDLVTMDIGMPNGDGISATREIMTSAPTPIVVITARPVEDGSVDVFEALGAGAIDVVAKPAMRILEEKRARDAFLTVLRAAARVRVIGLHRRPTSDKPMRERTSDPPEQGTPLVAIGASTGGPHCIRTVLSKLIPEVAPPVVIVQHMGSDFVPGFARWLGGAIALPVAIATHRARLEPGRVFIAPGDRHLTVEGAALALSDEPHVHFQRPAVDVLFESVARAYPGRSVGVLLTGMGEDGARGLGVLRDGGALTLAQDVASAVASGMPGTAARLGAAEIVATPHEIAARLARLRYAPQGVAGVQSETLVSKGSAR